MPQLIFLGFCVALLSVAGVHQAADAGYGGGYRRKQNYFLYVTNMALKLSKSIYFYQKRGNKVFVRIALWSATNSKVHQKGENTHEKPD
ncbi:hypothetical protein M1N12_02695 [Peptococcaceae bacterium]|nr:hypothetical protein [Peptococcaceae bacterium]